MARSEELARQSRRLERLDAACLSGEDANHLVDDMNAATVRPAAPREAEVTPRKLSIEFPDQIPKYWYHERPFMTQMLNTYTLLVPDNENYYIRQLRRCMDELDDPRQREELLRFFRQEGQHGIGHKAFWRNLDAQGVQYQGFLSAVSWFLYRFLEPILPRAAHLASIACLEHINAYLGNLYLSGKLLADADPRMRTLFEWHFAEEIEHKAVAFDVYQSTVGSYLMRLVGAGLVFPLFYLVNTAGTFYLLAQDRKALSRATWRDLGRFLFTDGALRHMLRHVFEYLRPGFHPWQTQDYALADEFFRRAAAESSLTPAA